VLLEVSVNLRWLPGSADRLTQAVDSIAGTISRSYDLLDDLMSEVTPQGTVNYTLRLREAPDLNGSGGTDRVVLRLGQRESPDRHHTGDDVSFVRLRRGEPAH
jgi:hypothetical protein